MDVSTRRPDEYLNAEQAQWSFRQAPGTTLGGSGVTGHATWDGLLIGEQPRVVVRGYASTGR